MIKAAVMSSPNTPLEVREFPEPQLEPGAVLLKTIFSEVCGTDVHLHHGQLSGVPYPIIPGHVSVGEIESVAGDVADVNGAQLSQGDIVTFLDVHETCGKCWYCLVAKASTRCPYRKVYGITYSATEGLLGGWSQAIYLKPGVKILKLPEGLSPEKFIAAGCGMPTAIHALERAEVKIGDTVVVQGSGPVGLSAAVLAQLSGATEVIVIGAPQLRLNMAKNAGADFVINVEQQAPEQRISFVKDLTDGRGADVVIEATGNPSAVLEGIHMTRDHGRYVVVGQYTDAGPVTLNPHLDINRKHIEIRGCWGTDFSHVYRGVKVLAKYADRFSYAQFISRIYSLYETDQALSDVEQLKVIKAVIKP